MPLIERLKDAVGAGAEKTYRYHCQDCGTEFETTEMSLGSVECPNCGGSGSRTISRM